MGEEGREVLDDPSVFSVAVIGLGMIGSATCRYLSSWFTSSVIGIGPPEPLHWQSHPGVFASHYGQGRIALTAGSDPIWCKLSALSISRYAQIENESGIRFHSPVGCLTVIPSCDQPGDSLPQLVEVGKGNGAVMDLVTRKEELCRRFPYFQFKDEEEALLERGGAGCINPRAMLRAQLALARKNGATILEETVTEITSCEKWVKISTDKGNSVIAQKAMVCAGAYSRFLLPEAKLELKTKAISVVLAEVGDEEKLQSMPCFVWYFKSHKCFNYAYGCPPLSYPNGNVYVKIGAEAKIPVWMSSLNAINEWFRGHGNSEETAAILNVLNELMPDLPMKSLEFKPCVVTYTAHGYPYIDAVDGKPLHEARLFVAAGGCGEAANSSDEIGRIAAMLVKDGKWSSDLDASSFRAVFA